MVRRWRLPIRRFCVCLRKETLEVLSQASSHFNVDVQKLLFVSFCAHSSEDWLSRTVQNKRGKRRRFTASKHKDVCTVLGSGAKPLINILTHFVVYLSISHEK